MNLYRDNAHPGLAALAVIEPGDSGVAMDRAHALFIVGCVLAQKPLAVVELGIGSGYLTRLLLGALEYNGVGALISVDNWIDWQGTEPPIAQQLRTEGAVIVVSEERVWCEQRETGSVDCLVVDSDHLHGGEWVQDHLRIVRPGGLIFFHDTNAAAYPSLKETVKAVRGLPHLHFTTSSRPEERCGRGLLFVVNQ